MSVSEKTKAFDNKMKQNKVQYDLDRQSAKISALSSRNVNKHESWIGEDVLPEKYFLEKSYYNEKVRIFVIRKWVEKKEDDEANKKPTLKIFKESDLVYNNKFSFSKYYDVSRSNTFLLIPNTMH